MPGGRSQHRNATCDRTRRRRERNATTRVPRHRRSVRLPSSGSDRRCAGSRRLGADRSTYATRRRTNRRSWTSRTAERRRQGQRRRLEREWLARPSTQRAAASPRPGPEPGEECHAAMGRQPLVSAAHDGISRPSTHADGTSTGELRGVDDDSTTDVLGPRRHRGHPHRGPVANCTALKHTALCDRRSPVRVRLIGVGVVLYARNVFLKAFRKYARSRTRPAPPIRSPS